MTRNSQVACFALVMEHGQNDTESHFNGFAVDKNPAPFSPFIKKAIHRIMIRPDPERFTTARLRHVNMIPDAKSATVNVSHQSIGIRAWDLWPPKKGGIYSGSVQESDCPATRLARYLDSIRNGRRPCFWQELSRDMSFRG